MCKRHALEQLPTELLILILFQIPDHNTLQSLVFASPACHQSYLMIRHELLHYIMKRQYGEFLDLSEALVAIRSKGDYMELHKEQAIALLDIRRRSKEINNLAITPESRADEPTSLEEIIDLLHFHKEMHFFLDDYSKNAPRPAWIDPSRWTQMLPLQLSGIEKRRFLRALCRLQILSHIFHKPEEKPDGSYSGHYNQWFQELSDEDAWRLWYGALLPWESEEIGCVWSYLKTKYPPLYPEIIDKDEQPPGAQIECVDDLYQLPRFTEGLASIGPRFLYRVLHATPRIRRDLIFTNASDYPWPWIGYQVAGSWDENIPWVYPADKCNNVATSDELWSVILLSNNPTTAGKGQH
ncbi:uncharacterized protein N7459_006027 [Penicillium hispanicum]|uniref:uncharacterized protein n=1 Tax=Penicillium hispanicum TaxID=1080232 RepID=UPI00253F6CA2|nr:uncharacterized protein N7459_006027 [Penicillium hispanicum]KAJ5580042.1 hypothetical protein N7459_006027 [Penicillium hispanicum]